MSEMVERVTKAIRHSSCFLKLTDEQLELAARAAIEAMREPSEEMVNAAYENCHEANSARFDSNIDFAEGVWRAMIDAALK